MLVTMLPLVLLLEYGHSVTGIVGELIRVASIECFAMTEILAQLVGTRAGKAERVCPPRASDVDPHGQNKNDSLRQNKIDP